jgi:hypothetical protein
VKSLGKKTTLQPVEVLDRAMEFFGPAGLGLAPRGPNGDCVTFEGGGGYMSIEACPQGAGHPGSDVRLTALEWEKPAQAFIAVVI